MIEDHSECNYQSINKSTNQQITIGTNFEMKTTKQHKTSKEMVRLLYLIFLYLIIYIYIYIFLFFGICI